MLWEKSPLGRGIGNAGAQRKWGCKMVFAALIRRILSTLGDKGVSHAEMWWERFEEH